MVGHLSWVALLLASPAGGAELVRHREVIGRIRGQEVGYHLVLPPEPSSPQTLLVYPGHPTGTPDPTQFRPPPRERPLGLLHLDGFNVLYARYEEDRYLRVAARPRIRRKIAAIQREALTQAVAEHGLDAARLVCMGVSASGNACWDLAIRWPGVFAGILPASAGYHPSGNPTCWANLADQQIYVLHGSEDPLIRDAWVDQAVTRARQEGATVVDVRVDGAGHGDFASEVWHAAFKWAETLPPPPAARDRCVERH